ncbi:hypothetical protein HW115_05390 [Verrucomicrobiaceae bacterium N1E253]|uniref:LamG-like jellyroll fold domain-containing protein n=1 Tax=Oceaniferula marina TaxID=2748318 RepID=A0A851GDL8_9BACT|nr:LamG domain-containing protein [Oceaniferula marina]NWK55032.1 hypothetical protein [Oceaniferula marina]
MNTPTPESNLTEWIEQTMLDLKDGHGSVSQVQAFRELLASNPEARRIYLKNNQLDHLLTLSPASIQSETTHPKQNKQPKRFVWKQWHVLSGTAIGAGIAAAITLLLVAKAPQLPSEPEIAATHALLPMASLEASYNAEITGNAAIDDTNFDKGKLSLNKGIAEISFRNGAQIVLDGHCGFEILNEKHVILTQGKMWAHCPPEAHGFKVSTPGGKDIIDLGTEFGVQVNPAGETNVHVFDGLVEVASLNKPTQQVTRGTSMQWSVDAPPRSATFVGAETFTTAETLRQRRVDSYKRDMLERSDLLLYYDFNNLEQGKVPNLASGAMPNTHGEAPYAIAVTGRSKTSQALFFDKPKNSVSLHFERPPETLTYTTAAWIKASNLNSSLMAILNTDAWPVGATHFQVTRKGGLRSGIRGGKSFETSSGIIRKGQWHLVAVSRDLRDQSTTFYCDGKRIGSRLCAHNSPSSPSSQSQFGQCTIGSWSDPIYPNSQRTFKGFIDEVMIFDHALSEKKIQALYEAGKP